MAKHGKKYLEALKLVEPEKLYLPQEAISLLKKMNYVKFDSTLEIHMKLGVDPRHADQMVRGVAMLPAGTGKEVKVLVFAQGESVPSSTVGKGKAISSTPPAGTEAEPNSTVTVVFSSGEQSFSVPPVV